MKDTQKLRLTIEEMTIDTTYRNLPDQVKFLADRLEKSDDNFNLPEHDVVVMQSGASLYVSVGWIGKPKKHSAKIFGYDSEELMSKQYK